MVTMVDMDGMEMKLKSTMITTITKMLSPVISTTLIHHPTISTIVTITIQEMKNLSTYNHLMPNKILIIVKL